MSARARERSRPPQSDRILSAFMFKRKAIVIVALGAAACGGGSGSTSITVPSAVPTATPALLLTIAELTSASIPSGGGAQYPVGHSMTVSQPHSFSGVRFSWLDDKGNGLPASGTMGIYTREYVGLLKDMPSAPGFVGRSIRTEGSDFVFDDSVVLNPEATYWFLSDTPGPLYLYTSQGNVDLYPGGDFYSCNGSGEWRRFVFNAQRDRIDANFRVSGRPK